MHLNLLRGKFTRTGSNLKFITHKYAKNHSLRLTEKYKGSLNYSLDFKALGTERYKSRKTGVT